MRIGGMRLDGRTLLAKRVGELGARFVEALGGPDKLTALQLDECGRAAALTVIAEQAMAKHLAGDASASADDCIKAQRLANQALAALGIGDAGGQPKG
jgi:hypothetical protein